MEGGAPRDLPRQLHCGMKMAMKVFLGMLVVILTGLVFWVRHVSVRPSEAHRGIIAGLKEELADSESERDRLVAELAAAKAEIQRLGAGRASTPAAFPDAAAPVTAAPSSAAFPSGTAASPAAPAAPPAGAATLDERLRQLAEIHHRNHSGLVQEKATRQASLESLVKDRKLLADSPFNFSEQTTVTDTEGNVTGVRGVRTSSADRDRAYARRSEQLAEMDVEIKELTARIAATEAEIRRLDLLYENAVATARSDFGAP